MFLEKIVGVKRKEIQSRKSPSRQRELEEAFSSLSPPRDFMDAISRHSPMAVIAEIKRASPSLGAINEKADILQLCREYERGGASAVSVLTEAHFFKGDLSFIPLTKKETSLPVLQKDFIIDLFQIYEGRASGADAVLLIAALLDREQLRDFMRLAQDLGMVPLVEIHNEEDWEKASALGLSVVGINNRDLKTFEIDLKTTLRLRKKIPPEIKVVSESGIRSPQDVRVLREAGVDAVLVGEILMRSNDPALKIREFLSLDPVIS